MNALKPIATLVFLSLLVWVGLSIYLMQENTAIPDRIKNTEDKNRKQMEVEYQQKIKKLQWEYTRKKHLATGETVFDRVYNTQGQSIVELIQRLADEALPKDWSSEVKVEEFTHFILLIYLPHNSQNLPSEKIASYLGPILEHGGWVLTDVAIFDRTHSSYLFFDKALLDEIRDRRQLSNNAITHAEEQGRSFTQFNSTIIECEKQDSHLFVPIEVAGPTGVNTAYALLDTGASTTTLSYEIVSSTGSDDLQNVPRRGFNTAMGMASFPIVSREINVGGIRKSIEIAVNQKDDINLLGVNFFDGMDYLVDFQNSAIYVWKK